MSEPLATQGTLQTPGGSPTVLRRLLALLRRFDIYVVFVALLLLCGAASPAFLSANNVSNMLQQVAPLGIVVIGQAFVIIVRGLDLSVGSVMATAAVIATGFSGHDADVVPIILLSLLMGLATGLVNGLLVTKRSVSPFLATLATWIVLEGFRYAYTHGAPSGNVPPWFRQIGAGHAFGLPVNILLTAVLALGFAVLLHAGTFGRRAYLVGGNPVMARLVGVRVDTVTIICYMISGLLAAVAGLVLSGFVGLVDNFVGRGFELDSVVAAVLGGIPLSGGRGSIAGGLVGAATLVLISNAVLLFGLPVQLQLIIKGAVIIAAAAIYVGRRQ